MQEGDNSSIEFQKVLQEAEEYYKLKTDTKKQAEIKMRWITKEQQEELLEHGRKMAKRIFYGKLQIFQIFKVAILFKA